MTQDMPLAYYYPTTVIFVDDDEDFLCDLTLHIDDSIAYKFFSSPDEALQHINSFQHGLSDGVYNDTAYKPASETVSSIKNHIFNPRRFSATSVVIADYKMPGMDGLSFCRNIQDSNIKKILLTAVLKENSVIKSFNDGDIDVYIKKQDRQCLGFMNFYINRCQRDYFLRNKEIVKSISGTETYSFITHPSFVRHFNKLCQEYNVTEYYLVNDPAGYIFVASNHEIYRLVVLDESEVGTYIEQNQQELILPFHQLGDSIFYCGLIKEKLEQVAFFREYINELDKIVTGNVCGE